MANKRSPPPLLMTRPKAASEAFVRHLQALKLPIGDVVISPAIAIRSVGGREPISGYGSVIATSAHAFESVRGGDGVVAWCVGDATARAARQAGFRSVSSGGTANDLVALLAEKRPDGPLLYLRGQHVSTDLADRLRANALGVEERVVYDQVECSPTTDATTLLRDARRVVVPLFSPRSAGIVAAWTAEAPAKVIAVAMSDQIAGAWPGPAYVSECPTMESMIDAVAVRLKTTANG